MRAVAVALIASCLGACASREVEPEDAAVVLDRIEQRIASARGFRVVGRGTGKAEGCRAELLSKGGGARIAATWPADFGAARPVIVTDSRRASLGDGPEFYDISSEAARIRDDLAVLVTRWPWPLFVYGPSQVERAGVDLERGVRKWFVPENVHVVAVESGAAELRYSLHYTIGNDPLWCAVRLRYEPATLRVLGKWCRHSVGETELEELYEVWDFDADLSDDLFKPGNR